MRRSLLCPSLIVALSFAFMCNRTEANLFYDFEEDGTGTVLATLELSSLPATHTEVVGLTFTPEGEAIFELGPVYLGDFDRTTGPGAYAIDDGVGGLKGDTDFVEFRDINPPYAAVPPFGDPPLEVLVYFDSVHTNYIDGMEILDLVGDATMRRGAWRYIPEPASLTLIGVAVIVGAGMRRRRKRQQ